MIGNVLFAAPEKKSLSLQNKSADGLRVKLLPSGKTAAIRKDRASLPGLDGQTKTQLTNKNITDKNITGRQKSPVAKRFSL